MANSTFARFYVMIAISLLRPYPNSDIHAAVSANPQIIAARPAI